jgi:hypothetical protein
VLAQGLLADAVEGETVWRRGEERCLLVRGLLGDKPIEAYTIGTYSITCYSITFKTITL